MRRPLLDPRQRPRTLVAWLWVVVAILVIVVAAGSVVARF
jgi:hypothetical protein